MVKAQPDRYKESIDRNLLLPRITTSLYAKAQRAASLDKLDGGGGSGSGGGGGGGGSGGGGGGDGDDDDDEDGAEGDDDVKKLKKLS